MKKKKNSFFDYLGKLYFIIWGLVLLYFFIRILGDKFDFLRMDSLKSDSYLEVEDKPEIIYLKEQQLELLEELDEVQKQLNREQN